MYVIVFSFCTRIVSFQFDQMICMSMLKSESIQLISTSEHRNYVSNLYCSHSQFGRLSSYFIVVIGLAIYSWKSTCQANDFINGTALSNSNCLSRYHIIQFCSSYALYLISTTHQIFYINIDIFLYSFDSILLSCVVFVLKVFWFWLCFFCRVQFFSLSRFTKEIFHSDERMSALGWLFFAIQSTRFQFVLSLVSSECVFSFD